MVILWWPVSMGVGISLYFSLLSEPDVEMAVFFGLCSVFLCGSTVRASVPILMPALLVAGVCAGVALSILRSAAIDEPVLRHDVSATIEGRLLAVSRSVSGNPRLLLDDVLIYGVAEQPARVRIALTRGQSARGLVPGDRIRIYARLAPPSAPTEPGGYDFRRHAYFERLGAVGYTDAPPLRLMAASAPDLQIRLLRWRYSIARQIKAILPGRTGGFAAAILVGDRSDIPTDTLTDLRAANLAHLLAISGLHMGLVTGFVFALVRICLALWPAASFHIPCKKLAACAAFLAAISFLMISGASVATQRAFIMTLVVLGAVLLDRPVFTLRAVALAATVILFMRPESLMSPGFQMSFAATTALVATFDILRRRAWWRDIERGWISRLRPVLSLAIASLVAGCATAPIGAYHFNQVASYGLIANLLAVPVMSFYVMPLGVLSVFMAPFGQEAWPLSMMGYGIEIILRVAETIADLPASTSPVPSAGPSALGWIIAAGLAGCLLRGTLRLSALPLCGLGVLIWLNTERPFALISQDGDLIGVLTEDGRALNISRGNGFTARAWAEQDGMPLSRQEAFGLWPEDQHKGQAYFESGEATISWSDKGVDMCQSSFARAQIRYLGQCIAVTQASLDHGPAAIFLTPDGPVMKQDALRARPWSAQ